MYNWQVFSVILQVVRYAQLERAGKVVIVVPMRTHTGSLSLYENRLQNDSVAIVSIPSELGSDARGLAETPKYLLEHGLEAKIAALGAEVRHSAIVCPKSKGIELQSRAKNLKEVAAVSRASSKAVATAAARGDFVLALGGDHSIAVGTVSGAATVHKRLGLVWIDAHPDANTEETTLSGNIHGMPVAVLMGYGNEALTTVGGSGPKILPEHMLYIGLKDLDQAEIDFIRQHRIAAVTMHDIVAHALAPAFDAIDKLKGRVDRIWVSMDIDSIDEMYSPGVAMNSMGGLTRREVVAIANYIGKTTKLAGMDLVEMVPEKDVDGKTARLALELVSNFLGFSDGSYAEYMEKYAEAGNMPEILLPSSRTRA